MDHISHLFNKFVGKEVPVVEAPHSFHVKGGVYTADRFKLANPNDPVIREMQEVAEKNGLTLHIAGISPIQTMDYLHDRLHVSIERGGDGKWRVGKSFGLG